MKRLYCVALCIICLTVGLTACQASKKGPGALSSAPDREIVRLLKAGEVDEAAKFVVVEEEFFASSYGDPKVKAVVEQLRAALSQKYSPQLKDVVSRVNAINWPAPKDEWGGIRNEILQQHRVLEQFINIPPFEYSLYRPDAYTEAVEALNGKEVEIRLGASFALKEYPLEAEQSFFELYPVVVDGGEVMRDNQTLWKLALSEFSKKQSDNFFSLYGKYLPRSAKGILGKKFFDSLCPNPKKADLKKILSAYRQVEAADMPLVSIPGIKVAFLQVTNPDLIRKKTLDFPLSVKVDVPFEASKASMIKMFTHKSVKEADIVVLVSVALARAERVAGRNEKVESVFVESYQSVENPEYAIAKSELDAAAREYHDAQAEVSYSWGARIVEKLITRDDKVERVRATQVRMEDLKEQIRNTPMHVQRPSYQPYNVTKAHMDIYKLATVNYYVIDKRNKRYFRDTFDYKEKGFFTVHYGMHERDVNKEKLLQTSVLEEDVVRYELSPIVVNLSDLLEQYVNTPSAWKGYSSMMTIHRLIAKDSERAQTLYNSDHYDYDKYYDQRFDNVVQVRNLGLGLGAGFYVTDEFIITNYHVVGESNYVRLKRFDDREFMGRVIARDSQSDLALIEADVKGKPVCFYDKNRLPLGVPLEIIGHPDGYQFSITRGVISSMREVSLPERRRMMYIQTDAATNGGNSGGPVFLGQYVVGVHDWGKKKASNGLAAQGLNFSIHYSEVFKFFDRHGIEVCKGSE